MGATSAKHAPPFGARRAVLKGRPAAKRAASPRGVEQRRATRFREVAVGVVFDSCTLSPLFSVPKLCVQTSQTAIYAESEYIHPNLHKSKTDLPLMVALQAARDPVRTPLAFEVPHGKTVPTRPSIRTIR